VQLGVIVLNWNGREWLERCLPSVLADDSAPCRIFVADNGSVDGSLEMVRTRWPQVEIVANGRNLRFAAGNNAAARVAIDSGCTLLLLLNNDAELVPGALGRIGAAFEREARLGIVGPRIVYTAEPDRIWFGGGIARPHWAWFAHRAIRRRKADGADPAGPTDWVTGCALAVRSELFAALGGLDESFYIYAEDVDFCLRARAAGWHIAYEPAAEVRHAVSASVGGRRSAFKVYHQSRARRQLVERHVRGAWRGVALTCSLVQDLLLAAWLMLRGNASSARAALQGYWDLPRDVVRHTTP
jgi:GT2 family glycosyltransferase